MNKTERLLLESAIEIEQIILEAREARESNRMDRLKDAGKGAREKASNVRNRIGDSSVGKKISSMGEDADSKTKLAAKIGAGAATYRYGGGAIARGLANRHMDKMSLTARHDKTTGLVTGFGGDGAKAATKYGKIINRSKMIGMAPQGVSGDYRAIKNRATDAAKKVGAKIVKTLGK